MGQKSSKMEGERAQRMAQPEWYVDSMLEKGGVSEEYLLVFVQNELHDALQSFLNGGFSKAGFALYPLVQDVSLENRQRLERLRTVATHLNQKNGRMFAGSAAYAGRLKGPGACSAFLSLLSKDFCLAEKGKTKQERKRPCEGFSLKEYDKKDHGYLQPVKGLQEYAGKKLADDVKGCYLHGSLATNDFVKGWSDCDTLLVIGKEALHDPRRLLALRRKIFLMRRFFFRIDPLQHHGSMIVPEHDLEWYSSAYFPLPLFSYAKALTEDSVLSIGRREMGPEQYAKLFWFVQRFRGMREEKVDALGSYDAKNFLHLIALFPSLYLQAKDVLVYKKFSFSMAKKDFGEELWEPIETMSSIRERWQPFPELPFVRLKARANPVAPYRINAYLGDLLLRMRKKNPVPVRELVEGMHLLAEDAWSKAAKRL